MSVEPHVLDPVPLAGLDDAPAVASAREYLRSNMPAIYADTEGFAMRLLEALEQVLDPQIAILDCLAAYLSPQLAPPGMVETMADWLGLPPAKTYGQQAGRKLLGVAERLARSRGTRAGLELALEQCFPDLHLQVEDHGGVTAAGEAASTPAPSPPAPSTPAPSTPYPGFTVRCRESLSAIQRAEVVQTIEWQRPMQVPYTLLDGDDTNVARGSSGGLS